MGIFYFNQKRVNILSDLNKHIYMTVLLSKVLKKVQLRWKVANLKREWDALRQWASATKSSPRLLQLEKARVQQQRPNAAKNK